MENLVGRKVLWSRKENQRILAVGVCQDEFDVISRKKFVGFKQLILKRK